MHVLGELLVIILDLAEADAALLLRLRNRPVTRGDLVGGPVLDVGRRPPDPRGSGGLAGRGDPFGGRDGAVAVVEPRSRGCGRDVALVVGLLAFVDAVEVLAGLARFRELVSLDLAAP